MQEWKRKDPMDAYLEVDQQHAGEIEQGNQVQQKGSRQIS